MRLVFNSFVNRYVHNISTAQHSTAQHSTQTHDGKPIENSSECSEVCYYRQQKRSFLGWLLCRGVGIIYWSLIYFVLHRDRYTNKLPRLTEACKLQTQVHGTFTMSFILQETTVVNHQKLIMDKCVMGRQMALLQLIIPATKVSLTLGDHN